MRRRRLIATWAAIVLVAGVALLLGAVAWYQRFGVYAFDQARYSPAEVGLQDVRVVRFRSEDGADVAAWLLAPRDDRPLLISFAGGFTSIGSAAARMRPLVERGFGFAMLVYRGSSGEPGVPGEEVFAADARALHDQLDGLLGVPVPVERRVLHGVSLGSSVAAGLARDRAAAGLVLEASFDRCCRWHSRRMFRLPMCFLMWRERHDVVDKLRSIAMPVLQLHGERDDAVPIAWARALHAALPPGTRFVTYPEGGHTDLLEHGGAAEIEAFARGSTRQR